MIALTLFVALPFVGFLLGQKYQKTIDSPFMEQSQNQQGTTNPLPKISESEAIVIVKSQPEVKSWLSLFNSKNGTSKLGGGSVTTVDRVENGKYVIHVYESLPDHIATFNWYLVDVSSGKVTKEFNY